MKPWKSGATAPLAYQIMNRFNGATAMKPWKSNAPYTISDSIDISGPDMNAVNCSRNALYTISDSIDMASMGPRR